MNTETGIGRRLARIRKDKKLSQQQLADRLGYSVSWVKKVESGSRTLDRYSVLNAVARALGVHVSELTGEPLHTRDDTDRSVREIRDVLMSDAADGGNTRPPATLSREVSSAILTRQAGRFASFGAVVPELLAELERSLAEATGHDRETAATALVSLLHGTAMLLRRLGHPDLAWIALQRAERALLDSGDPLVPVAQQWQVAENLFKTGNTTEALRVVGNGLAALDEVSQRGPAWHSLNGTLHLLEAIGAAQRDDAARVIEAIGTARRLADQVGPGRDDHQTVFGPAEVDITGVAASVELGQTGDALQHARQISRNDIATVERQARFLIDLARAHAQAVDANSAYRAIREAYRLAPEYVGNHVMAREVTTWLLEHDRRSGMTGLRTMARHMGIA